MTRRFAFCLGALWMFILPTMAQAQGDTEVLYLTDTGSSADGTTTLYRVHLDDGTGRANLEQLAVLPFNHVDALAATPGGSRVYCIDDSGSAPVTRQLGYYVVESGAFIVVGTMHFSSGSVFLNTDQAAFSPGGILYVTRNEDDSLYTVDVDTAEVTLVGVIKNRATGVNVDIGGADIVFDADGNLYLWTSHNRSGAPVGLYQLELPATGGIVYADRLGGPLRNFTGLAIRENGLGDLVGSTTDDDSIVIVNKTNGAIGTSYPMYKGGIRFTAYQYGDMTAGPLAGVEICEPYTTTMFAGQHINAGKADITVENGELVILVDATSPWMIKELHIYVGTGPVPGLPNPAPGQFPYKFEFTEFQTAYTVRIPLADLGVDCDDEVNVAIHATMVKVIGGEVVQTETAWAYGPNEFGGRWGWWFVYVICCEDGNGGGCTHTVGYWKTHNSYRENPSQYIPWPILGAEDYMLCGKTWYNILWTSPKGGDAWLILAHQWIAAKLNIADGASVPPEVLAAVDEAEAILMDNCSKIPKNSSLRDDALALAYLLDEYNNGYIGPGHCDDQ